MPIATSLLADRESKNASGPSIQVLYRNGNNELIKGKTTYLSPLKKEKEGIVVSTTLDMVGH